LRRAEHSSKEFYHLCKKDCEIEEEARAQQRAAEPLIKEKMNESSLSLSFKYFSYIAVYYGKHDGGHNFRMFCCGSYGKRLLWNYFHECSSKSMSSVGGGRARQGSAVQRRTASIVSVAIVWYRHEAAVDNRTSRE
jgi:hypothetical protein